MRWKNSSHMIRKPGTGSDRMKQIVTIGIIGTYPEYRLSSGPEDPDCISMRFGFRRLSKFIPDSKDLLEQ